MNDKRKQLECLYVWSDFYSQNQQWVSMDKVQEQISEFKKQHGFV